ncbi:MAG: DUF6702 family protein, partial [Bacteroidota bacterium]
MKRRHMAWILALFTSISCFGHNPVETSSIIEIQERQLQVRLDLPWSLRQAVVERFSNLKDTNDKVLFQALTRQYIEENFLLTKAKQSVKAEKIELLDSGHSHSLVVLLWYDISDYKELEIKNSLLFNLHKKQRNHHAIIRKGDGVLNMITSPSKPYFMIDGADSSKKSLPIQR